MDKDEILAKSRAEHKNKDVYEQEVLKQGNKYAILVLLVLAFSAGHIYHLITSSTIL